MQPAIGWRERVGSILQRDEVWALIQLSNQRTTELLSNIQSMSFSKNEIVPSVGATSRLISAAIHRCLSPCSLLSKNLKQHGHALSQCNAEAAYGRLRQFNQRWQGGVQAQPHRRCLN